MERYDVVVIGAGPGGYVAAIRAAQLGKKVALVEKNPTLGGTCLNVGCIPSKALLESSELLSTLQHKLGDHGISTGPVAFDLATLMARKTRVVKEVVEGLGLLMKKNKITVVAGRARIAAPGRVLVETPSGNSELEAGAIVVATGSAPVELPFLKFDGTHILSSTEVLSLDKVPGHLVVIGAGAVGLELGSVWKRLGAQVTVVEMLPQIAPFADAQMARTLERALKDQGLTLRTKTQVTAATVSASGVELALKNDKGADETLPCDRVLVAVGRRPYTEGLGLEDLGIVLDKGRIPVDDRLQSTVPGIYAIGDVVAGPMLAHKAEEEGVAVAENIAGLPGHVSYDAIPNVIYTWPELAQVGISEEQAKADKRAIKVGRYYFKANARAKTMGEQDGLVKVIADAGTDQILGVHIVGARASDMIAEAAIAMEFKGSAEDLGRAVHAHPTLSEILKEAALAVDRRAIHG
ncbi:MAG: dihydrolipoyl dehydrogenase [Pseudomonadota bacterium]